VTQVPRHLRIVVGGGMGDCLLHTPFIRHFRKTCLYSRITCVVPNRALELFDHNPHIDRLIGCEVRMLALWALPEPDCDIFAPFIQTEFTIHPDGALSPGNGFQIKCRNNPLWLLSDVPIVRQTALRHAIALEDERLEVITAREDEEWAATFVSECADHPLVLLNRRTSSTFKEYPRASWQAVADSLENGAAVVDIATREDALAGVRCVDPRLPLRRTAALFRRARCVVTIDSFAGHLAAAMGTPAVVIFGPSNPAVFGHAGNRNIRCAPCEPCYDPAERACGEPACLTQLPPQLIIEAVSSELARSRPARVFGPTIATRIVDVQFF